MSKVPARWIRTKADERAVAEGHYWDQAAVNRVLEFFPKFLRLGTGRYANRPFILEDYQVDLLSRAFGWRRPDGTRRFREIYLSICKKNGKSTLLAGLAIYGMIEEPGAGIYQGALNSKQADIILRVAAGMIRKSPKLRKHFRILKHNKTITYDRNEARLECMTADVDSKDGVDSSMTILDEIHRWGHNRQLYDVMKGAGAAREQPMLWMLTTAGDDQSVFCREIHDIALAIINGDDSNLSFLGVIYAASPKDDIESEATWHKANPALGSILSLETFRNDFEQAKKTPARLKNFLRLQLGLWQKGQGAWLDVKLWDEAAQPEVRDLSRWKGREVVAGLDLSTNSDLTSLSLATMDDDIVYLHSTYFLPEETIERRSREDGVSYSQWADEGFALETEGNATDFEAIRLRLRQLHEQGIRIKAIAIDPWNAAHLGTLLQADGFNVYFFRQNFGNFTGPCFELERRLLNGTIVHDDNPITRWCVGNCRIKVDPSGNIRPTKEKAVKERIDGVVSAIMALGVLTSNQIVTSGFEYA